MGKTTMEPPGDGAQTAARLSEWIRATESSLLRYTRQCLGSRLMAHYDPADILQDSYCSTWKALDRAGIGDEEAFVRWMKRVLRNRVFDLMRQVAVRNERGQEMDPAGQSDPVALAKKPDGSCWGEQACVDGDLDSILLKLTELSPEQRLCLILRDIVGTEWRVTAAIMGYSVLGAKSVGNRARGRIPAPYGFDRKLGVEVGR